MLSGKALKTSCLAAESQLCQHRHMLAGQSTTCELCECAAAASTWTATTPASTAPTGAPPTTLAAREKTGCSLRPTQPCSSFGHTVSDTQHSSLSDGCQMGAMHADDDALHLYGMHGLCLLACLACKVALMTMPA